MKKLQNNFTTPEQSKRLLELGLPADSADCYWTNKLERRIRQYAPETDNNFFTKHIHQIPCWSSGRLMDIVKICSSYKLAIEIYSCVILYLDIINGIINEMAYEIDSMDFSRLEE